MSDSIAAYPLQWPDGWRRADQGFRIDAAFRKYKNRLSVFDGVERVLASLGLMGIGRDDIVISTNVRTRLDGMPRSDQAQPADPGAAVYWKKRGQKRPQCMAIDRYDKVADNLAAIAATLEAMRAIERYGGAEILDRAFTGFIALPAPEQPFQVLGVSASATASEIDEAHRRLAMKHHPDRGGDADQMARINAARDAMLEAS